MDMFLLYYVHVILFVPNRKNKPLFYSFMTSLIIRMSIGVNERFGHAGPFPSWFPCSLIKRHANRAIRHMLFRECESRREGAACQYRSDACSSGGSSGKLFSRTGIDNNREARSCVELIVAMMYRSSSYRLKLLMVYFGYPYYSILHISMIQKCPLVS